MTLREISIGRSRYCDITLDPRCSYASSHHGTMYYDGTQLMFKDTSTNGTMINNVNVKHRAIPIHRGDSIMLAGKYPISWNQIDRYFPPTCGPQSRHGWTQPFAQQQQQQQPQQVMGMASANVDTSRFSWAAFFLSGIWGLFNGCWWMILVNIGFFFLCFVPIINFFAGIGSLITSIVFGINGTRWAWENRTWRSPQEFIQTQETWNKVAIILFVISIALGIIGIFIFFGAIVSLFS